MLVVFAVFVSFGAWWFVFGGAASGVVRHSLCRPCLATGVSPCIVGDKWLLRCPLLSQCEVLFVFGGFGGFGGLCGFLVSDLSAWWFDFVCLW